MGLFDDLNDEPYPEDFADEYVKRLAPQLRRTRSQRDVAQVLAEVPDRAIYEVVIAAAITLRESAAGHTLQEVESSFLVNIFAETPASMGDEVVDQSVQRGRNGLAVTRNEQHQARVAEVLRHVDGRTAALSWWREQGVSWLDGIVDERPSQTNEQFLDTVAQLKNVLQLEKGYLRTVENNAYNAAVRERPGLMSPWNDPRIAGSELLGRQGEIAAKILATNPDHLERMRQISELSNRLASVHPRQILEIVTAKLIADGSAGGRPRTKLAEFAQGWQDFKAASTLSPDDLRASLDGDGPLDSEIVERLMKKSSINPTQIAHQTSKIFENAVFGASGSQLSLTVIGDSGAASADLRKAVNAVRDASLYILQYQPQSLLELGNTANLKQRDTDIGFGI